MFRPTTTATISFMARTAAQLDQAERITKDPRQKEPVTSKSPPYSSSFFKAIYYTAATFFSTGGIPDVISHNVAPRKSKASRLNSNTKYANRAEHSVRPHTTQSASYTCSIPLRDLRFDLAREVESEISFQERGNAEENSILSQSDGMHTYVSEKPMRYMSQAHHGPCDKAVDVFPKFTNTGFACFLARRKEGSKNDEVESLSEWKYDDDAVQILMATL